MASVIKGEISIILVSRVPSWAPSRNLIHLTNIYCVHTYHMPGTIPGTGNTESEIQSWMKRVRKPSITIQCGGHRVPWAHLEKTPPEVQGRGGSELGKAPETRWFSSLPERVSRRQPGEGREDDFPHQKNSRLRDAEARDDGLPTLSVRAASVLAVHWTEPERSAENPAAKVLHVSVMLTSIGFHRKTMGNHWRVKSLLCLTLI